MSNSVRIYTYEWGKLFDTKVKVTIMPDGSISGLEEEEYESFNIALQAWEQSSESTESSDRNKAPSYESQWRSEYHINPVRPEPDVTNLVNQLRQEYNRYRFMRLRGSEQDGVSSHSRQQTSVLPTPSPQYRTAPTSLYRSQGGRPTVASRIEEGRRQIEANRAQWARHLNINP